MMTTPLPAPRTVELNQAALQCLQRVREQARGMVPLLNDSPDLIRALAGLVKRA